MKHIRFVPENLIKVGVVVSILMGLFIHITPGLASEKFASPAAAEYDHGVATAWFELQLKLVKETPGFSPPVASRAFGYTGIALYEAVVGGMPEYQSLVGQLNDLDYLPPLASDADYHWPTIASSAMATITRELFANAPEATLMAVDDLYERLASQSRDDLEPAVFNRSVRYGNDIALAVYVWSMTDGGHEGYLRNFPANYLPPAGSGLWVPTPRVNGDPQPALQPYWGNNRTFLPSSIDACPPSAPPAYSEEPDSEFFTEAMEVYETSQNLTQEQTNIALFWADDPSSTATPPGHSMSVLTQLLVSEDATLALSAEAYAKMGIAVADAFIGCWNAKYVYNLVRPVTYIQQFIDEDWMPILNTPPFPEYPSGHSVQTGAAAVVLAELFGEENAFTDHTHDDLGLAARSFDSFAEMADETALSRLYGGIHYRAAIELGLEQGQCIGQKVNALVFRQDA